MEGKRLGWLFLTIFVVVWFGFCCCEGVIEIVTSAICQGGNKCNDGSYFCDSNDCTLLCSSASTCQNSILICNSTFVNSTCEAKCHGVNSCKNFKLISYASETTVSCQESSNSADEVCQNATFTIQSTNDSDSNSFAIDCLTTNACNMANIYCSNNVDSCSATCQSADACDNMRMICDSTQQCSLQYDFATSCTDCHYYCPYMESNSETYNYTQDCSCIDENLSHVCSNVLEPSSSPTSLPSMEPSSMPTNEPAEIVPTAQPSAPIPAPTVVPTTVNNNGNETNGMISTTTMASTTENGNMSTINGNGNVGDALSASDDGDVSDIDVLWYNIVFAITFLVIVFYAAKEVFTLYQIGFFKNHSEISVIPTIFLIALWQFLCCMVLGFTETYVSNENVKSGTFVSSVTIPINLYTVLALMVAVLCYNKYPEMQRSLFAPLTRSIECLSSHCQVGSYYNFMLFIFLVVFILWMIITASLSGDNQSDLEFNSTMIVLYCLIGAYFAMLVLSAALSYSQRHDISLGNARSCCNPCIITILHRERKQKQDKEYYEKEGLSKEALEENEHKFWTFEPGCMIKACDCDVVTKEVLFGAAIGACLFFMFLFYMALAYDIGSTSADSVRCAALLFEVLSLIFLLIGHRYLGPESATRIDDNIIIEDETLPYQGHVRHQPSMDVVVHARKKNDPHGRNNLSNNDHPNMPYETLKDRTHHHQHHHHQHQASIDDGPHKSKNLFCCCFHKNKDKRQNGSNNHELRIDTDTEDTYMSASNNPPPASPSPLIQAYQSGMKKLAKFSLGNSEKNNSSNNLSVSTPRNGDDAVNSPKESQLDDADALKFDIKNVKKLIEDKVEYVEILAKRCVKQSEDIWKIARITYMDDADSDKASMNQSFRITVSYLDNTGIETLDLGNDVDAARFRVLLFGHPEPHKLPMHEWFGVPRILIDLLEKLFAPHIKGQHTEGIFRVPAEGSKLKHYRTAVCQYKINTYDYRLATQFKEQKDKDNAFDVHCIAGLIKEWLRKFPETIVVYDEEKQKLIPHKTNSPNDHLKQNMFDWLSYLIPVLADEKNENQMNVTALAIVIAPNLIGEDLEPIQHLKLANELNKNFAAHCEKMAAELEENPVIEWINEKQKETNEYIDDLSDDDDNHESDEKDVELPRYKTPQ